MTAATWKPVFDYLIGFSTFYPAIATWCAKVREDAHSGKRSVFAFVSSDGKIDGLAITKNGVRSKLCHISISDHARTDGRGASLMRAAAGDMLGSGARRIHVTTSEEVAAEYGEFFIRFGFARQSYRCGRYRPNADELEWEASRECLARRIVGSEHHGMPISLPLVPARTTLMRLRWAAQRDDFEWIPVSKRGAALGAVSRSKGDRRVISAYRADLGRHALAVGHCDSER